MGWAGEGRAGARVAVAKVRISGIAFDFNAVFGLGLGYFLRLHTSFPIPRSMQRVCHQGDCQGISAATEWDPAAMIMGRWRLNPIAIKQSGLPFRVTDPDWLVV